MIESAVYVGESQIVGDIPMQSYVELYEIYSYSFDFENKMNISVTVNYHIQAQLVALL